MGCKKLTYYYGAKERPLEKSEGGLSIVYRNPDFFEEETSEKNESVEKIGSLVYPFGFNGMERDDAVSGEGNSYDFGARMHNPRLGRWFSTDPKFEKFPSRSPYTFVRNSPLIFIDPDGEEEIIVIGAQSDNGSGNKMMFAHQAILKLKSYQGSEESKSIIIFEGDYTASQLKAITKSANKYGAVVITVSSADELVNYVNSKSQDVCEVKEERADDPVTSIDIFAHGYVGSIEFGYHLADEKLEESYRFDDSHAAQLNPEAFSEDALICSYACRTGLGGKYYAVQFPWNPNKKNESLAQKMADGASVDVNAYMRRTSYKKTLGTKKQRLLLKAGGAKKLRESVERREMIDGATWDPEGAMFPVKSGNSPKGTSPGMKKYTPKSERKSKN